MSVPAKNLHKPGQVRKILRAFRTLLWSGPVTLLTRGISFRTGALMILGVLPGILCAIVLTLPPFLFVTPQHQAYFYFGVDVEQNPMWLAPTAIAALCTLLVLALPAERTRAVFQRRR